MRNYYIHYRDGIQGSEMTVSLLSFSELLSWLETYNTEFWRQSGMIVTSFGFNTPTFG